MASNRAAFLTAIAKSEGADYNTLVGGGTFSGYSDHPRILNSKLNSTAAGRYQILASTWDTVIQPALHLPDFSPASQDAAAIYLIQLRGALPDVDSGNFIAAVDKVKKEWASLPGSPYGQPTRTIDKLISYYQQAGGWFSQQQVAKQVAIAGIGIIGLVLLSSTIYFGVKYFRGLK